MWCFAKASVSQVGAVGKKLKAWNATCYNLLTTPPRHVVAHVSEVFCSGHTWVAWQLPSVLHCPQTMPRCNGRDGIHLFIVYSYMMLYVIVWILCIDIIPSVYFSKFDQLATYSVYVWLHLASDLACVDRGFSCSHRHVGGVRNQRGTLHDRFFLRKGQFSLTCCDFSMQKKTLNQ